MQLRGLEVEMHVPVIPDTSMRAFKDVSDDFKFFYDMKIRLRGERSRQIFMSIWGGRELRKLVGVPWQAR